MSLDIGTLLYTILLAQMGFGLVHTCLLRIWPDEQHFALWSGFNFMGLLGGLAILNREIAPAFLTPFAAGCLLGAQALLWAGLRSFNDQPTHHRRAVLAVMAPPLLLGLTPLGDSLPARVSLYAIANAGFAGMALRDAYKAQCNERLVTRWLVAGALLANVLFALARLWSGLHDPIPVATLVGKNVMQPSATVTSLIVLFLTNLTLLLTVHERMMRRLQGRANSDALTHVMNRMGFAELGTRHLDRCVRSRQPATLMMLDLDHFKQVNDAHGHAVGDRLLCAFARTTRHMVRPGDLIARYGGEEFCVLLPNANLAQGADVAERLRRRFAALRLRVGGQSVQATVSIGVAELALPSEALEHGLARADNALYRAKHSGRNRVVLAGPETLPASQVPVLA